MTRLNGRDIWRQDGAVMLALGISATAFYLSPSAIVYVPALLCVAALAWYRLDLAILLVPAFTPYFMLPKPIGHEEFAPSEIFLALNVLVALGRLCKPGAGTHARWIRLRTSPFILPLGLFVLAGAASTVFASNRHIALRAARLEIFEPAIFFGLVLLVAEKPRQWRLMLVSVVLAGLAVATVGLVQFATKQDLTYAAGSSIGRIKALYGSPDNLGLLFDRVIPVWLAFLWVGYREERNRIVLGTIGVLLVSTLILTASRGAWVAVACGCLLLIVLLIPWGWRVAVAVILLGAAGAAAKGPSLAHALSSGHTGTVQRRVDVWKSALKMGRDHPIFGVGPDNFLHYYAPKHQLYSPCQGLGYMYPEASAEPCLSHPHNVFLDFWLSTGALGLIAFVWIEVIFWRISILLWRRNDSRRDVLMVGVMAAMLAGLIHGMVDNSYFLPDLSIMLWLLCAYVDFASRPSPTVEVSNHVVT